MLSFASRGHSSSSKSTKVAPFSGIPSKRIADANHQVQLHQLEEELKKEWEEKTKILDELTELRKKSTSQINDYDSQRMEMLEKVEKAKQSERKMHESLVILTRQLEQTKSSLESARIEINMMKESKVKEHNNNSAKAMIGGDHETRALRAELKAALEAEEKANKAMNDLALLLKEVKDELATTKKQLERTKSEVEESAAAWRQREESFLACIQESTEANNKLKQENTKLFESQRVIREENAKLRENIKKSFEEINAIKEELEAVKDENSQINKILTDKQNTLQMLKLDFESLKVSEAAAQRSLKELNQMLLIETTPKSITPYFSPFNGPKSPPDGKVDHDNKSQKGVSVGSSSSNLSEIKAASVAITEDTEQLERDLLIGNDGSERRRRKNRILGKFSCFFRGKSFKPIPPLPPPPAF